DLPDSAWVQQIKLTGLTGPANHRLAVISGKSFAQGEIADVKVAGKQVTVRCVQIRETSVLVEIQGDEKPRELFLPGTKPKSPNPVPPQPCHLARGNPALASIKSVWNKVFAASFH